MRINIGAMVIDFNGYHTANVTTPEGNVDCFTFGFAKDKASAIDFLEATLTYLDGLEESGVCIDCMEGRHGIPDKRNPNMCACCYAIVGRENLIHA